MNPKSRTSIMVLLLSVLAFTGTTTSVNSDSNIARGRIQNNPSMIKQVAAGGAHTCALLESGKVRCWGWNYFGQLGYGHKNKIGDNETPASAGYVDVDGAVKQISAGAAHTCALLESGKVRCWGANSSGELGYGHKNKIGDNETPASAGFVDVGGTVKQISAGSWAHTCALLESGKVRCWGYNKFGQLGYGHKKNIGDKGTPTSVDTVDLGGTVKQITAAANHTCALLESGKVRCWGYNKLGQLGYGHKNKIGDKETPASVDTVDLGGTVKQISAGGAHTCALLESGKVRCWGYNKLGQLGYGHKNDIGDNETPAGNVDVGETVKQISAGVHHTCALLESGKVRCWGWNLYGQLGYGHMNNIGDNETPGGSGDVDVVGTVKQISAGGSHSCALLESGKVRCWGYNAHGQLGYGHKNDIGDNETPGVSGEEVIPTGRNTAPLAGCEIKASGTLSNRAPLTLNWTSQNGVKAKVGPTNAQGMIPPADIPAGSRSYKSHYGHNYTMKVWNQDGILARCSVNIRDSKHGKYAPAASDSAYRLAPSASISGFLHATVLKQKPLTFSIKTRPAKGTVTITNASTGAFTYTANTKFLGIDGFTFTANDGKSDSNIARVRIQYNPPIVKQVAAGDIHTCALLKSGKVRCWGNNFYAQLGYGHSNSIGDYETPASAGFVDVGETAKQITAGRFHTCVLLESGKVRCWGRNGYGQLGYGHKNKIGDNETPAGDVDVGATVKQITAGGNHTCALLNSGKVRCWGSNGFGELGYGHANHIGDNETPAGAGDVDVGDTVKQITAGGNHTCALLNSGKIRCWGSNGSGQLGYGHRNNIGDNETPAGSGDVNVGDTVKQIIAGRTDHTCALLESGKVRCWGSNGFGELGYGNQNKIGDNETPASAGDVQL